jgi:S1-C subfamily serine protease
MKKSTLLLPATVILLIAGEAYAQTDAREAERRSEVQREIEVRELAAAERLREAEERMAAAAAEIAELSRERLPRIAQIERRFEYSKKPRIGITIDGDDVKKDVLGIEVTGVTPESAADDAGLRAGDIITAVNGESMKAESSMAANKRLLEFMDGVEEGDKLKIDYLRNGNAGTVELSPRVSEMHVFSWAPDVGNLHVPNAPGLAFPPKAVENFAFQYSFPFAGSAWGSLELVELNAGLGKYFGTDTGLLVVHAPDADEIDLQDGDVIQSIDGREPRDVRHAMRILSSYQSGEKLKLGIMRDKRKRTVEIEVPANQRGSLWAPAPPAAKPAKEPEPPKAPPEAAST